MQQKSLLEHKVKAVFLRNSLIIVYSIAISLAHIRQKVTLKKKKKMLQKDIEPFPFYMRKGSLQTVPCSQLRTKYTPDHGQETLK